MKFDKEIIIGLEIHVELNTKTKLFCSCKTSGDDTPNSRTCQVCLGHPGSKPVVNKAAIQKAVFLARALNCKIAKSVIFSRKNYFYPDLSKNFQITQYEEPIGKEGFMQIDKKKIGIARVHLEEDPASLVHPAGIGKSEYVLVDYNRSGNPLCEIVTQPELENAEEARDFLKNLIAILKCLEVYDARCIVKADANVSLKETGYIRAEIKNITGFKEIERALNYEIERQKQEGMNVQETRAWDSEKGYTYPLRKKESEEDYGYIFDPDLVPILIDSLKIQKLPELPYEKELKYNKMGISDDDSYVISNDFELTKIFEQLIDKINPTLAAKWVRRELVKVANYESISYDAIDLVEFIEILKKLEDGKITENIAKKLLEMLAKGKFDVAGHIKNESLEMIKDSSEIERYCIEAIKENKKAVDDYKSGKEEALNFLLGSVMKKSRGKSDAKKVIDMLKRLII